MVIHRFANQVTGKSWKQLEIDPNLSIGDRVTIINKVLEYRIKYNIGLTALNAATKQKLTRSSKFQSPKRAPIARLTKVIRFGDCNSENFGSFY
jgi:hypothetical protein